MKEVLFTHDDLDGAGCRIIFEIAHDNLSKGRDYLVYNSHNNTIDQDTLEFINSGRFNKREDILYYADICPSPEVLQMLHDNSYDVCIFDHHRTNVYATEIFHEMACIIPEYDGKLESGTSLLWKYYQTNKPYMNCDLMVLFQDTVRSYDTWEWKTTGNMLAKQLQTLFYLLGMDKFCKYYVDFLKFSYDPHLISDSHMMFVESRIEQEQRAIDDFITGNNYYDMNVAGYKTAFVLGSRGANVSEMCNQWLLKHPEYDIMCVYLPYDNTFSFRTVRDDINLGEDICKPIGGGGHPKAAGAPMSEEDIKTIIAIFDVVLNRR